MREAFVAASASRADDAGQMPTVLKVGPYRLFFYSSDGDEPRHVHVRRDDSVAKFWLDPVRMEFSVGLSASEIRRVERIIAENRRTLVERWDEYFGR
jgi:hypothetical protein